MNHVECAAQLAAAEAGRLRAEADLVAAVERVNDLREAMGRAEEDRDYWADRALSAEADLRDALADAADGEWRIEREDATVYDLSTARTAVRAPQVVEAWWLRHLDHTGRTVEEFGPYRSAAGAGDRYVRLRGGRLPAELRQVAEQLAEDAARGVL